METPLSTKRLSLLIYQQ